MRAPQNANKSSAKGRGRGRPVLHHLRPLIAIGAKLKVPVMDLSLQMACQVVNAVCDNPTIEAGAAEDEGALCHSTLRKHVPKLMGGTTWRNLRREEHLNLWEHVIRIQCPGSVDSILHLVEVACAMVSTADNAQEAPPTPALQEPSEPIHPSQRLMPEDTDVESVVVTDHLLELSTGEWSAPLRPTGSADLGDQLLGDNEACSLPQPDAATSLSNEDLVEIDRSDLPLLDDLDLALLSNTSGPESDLDNVFASWSKSDPFEGLDMHWMPVI